VVGGGYSPAQSATNQPDNLNIVLTFDEYVQAGTGNIVLTPSGGNQANMNVEIDITDPSQVTISDFVVTVNNTNLLDNRGGKVYTVRINSGVIQDIANNSFAGISGYDYLFSVVDDTPPLVEVYLPTQGATAQNKGANIVLTFNEFVKLGSGFVVITPSNGSGINTPVSIPVSDAQVSIAGVTVTINPSADLNDRTGKNHTITIASGVLKDINNNLFPGMSGNTYRFDVSDSTPPTVETYTPTHLATGIVKTTNVTLVFDELIKKGSTGNVVLTPTGGNQANPSVSIPFSSSEITVTDYTMLINPTNEMDDRGNKTYQITIDPGVILDVGDHVFTGIQTGTFQFQVDDATAPTVVTYSPDTASSDQPKDSNIVITFNEDVQQGLGEITITPSGGNQANVLLSISASDSQVTYAGTNVIIDPTNDLDDRGSKTMHIEMNSGVIKDSNGNAFVGLSGSTYAFNVADSTAPAIDSYSPIQHQLGVNKVSDVVLTFNEYVKANTGNIVITPSGGSGANNAIEIDVTDTVQVQFFQSVVTINPINDLDDRSNKTYTITALPGVIQDIRNNNFELSGDTYLFTVVDSTEPILISKSPISGATTVVKATPIVLTYNENMQFGSGNITLQPSGGNEVNPAAIIPVGDNQVSISGSVVTITPTQGLDDENSKLYRVTMPVGAFTDVLRNVASNISGLSYEFFVPDVTAPTITAYSPMQGEINVEENRNIVFTFSESITKGTGSILLNPTGGGVSYTMDISDPAINLAGSTLDTGSALPTVTINLDKDLVPGKEYKVTFPSHFVKDLAPTPNGILAMSTGTYMFQVKTKIVVQFVEQVNLVPIKGKIVLMSEGGITHVDVNDTSSVTFNANAITIRPSIVNQDVTGSWVVIIGDGTIQDTITGLKCAGVYVESKAYHVSEEGHEFLFYTTFRACSSCP